jgi:outer membrane protein assembly complex protein YaeT
MRPCVTSARLLPAASLVLGLVALHVPERVAAQGVASDSVEIKQVHFEGVHAFDPIILATAIETSEERCTTIRPLCWVGIGDVPQYFDSVTVARDELRLRLYYRQRGYREASARAELRTEPDGVRITFHIVEGEPVRVRSLVLQDGNQVPAEIGRNLPLRVGNPFDEFAFQFARDTLINRLNNRGYAWAVVLANSTIPTDSPHVAHVSYQIVPGPASQFAVIDVVGFREVSPNVIRRMLTFEAGDPYSREDVLASQRNLYAQQVFRHADIQVLPDQPEDSTVEVRVSVIEGDLHRARVGVGMSSADYLTMEGNWASHSFFGGARRLELRARVSNLFSSSLGSFPFFDDISGIYSRLNGLVAADFAQPWFFGPVNTFGAGIFLERRSVPGVFVRTASGGYISFARTLGNNASMNAAFRPELTDLATERGDLIFCIGFLACGENERRAISEAHWLAPLTLSLSWDRSNSLFNPTRGFTVRSESELASGITGSDFAYTRLALEVIDYSTIARNLVLATRVRPGIAWAMEQGDSALGLHPTRRFFGGGPNSVRGYAQFRLGPKLLTADPVGQLLLPADSGGAGCTPQQVNAGTCDASPLEARDPNAFRVQAVGGAAVFEGNVELRFPLFREVVRGVAFADVGQVWPELDRFNLKNLVLTPGIGFRYFSPVGPIRVDIGYNWSGAEDVTVVTSTVKYCPTGPDVCEAVMDGVTYDRRLLVATDTLRAQPGIAWNPRTSFWNRLQLHFSIGQAF